MTTVTHEEYWPAILADPTQYGLIQTADAEWNARAACVFEVLKNTLCARDNQILTQQWEATLELTPAEGATLNERKAVILYRLTEAPPLTIALLEKALVLLMGEGKAIVEHLPAEDKLVVHTDRADETQLAAVTALLERTLPKNIEVERYNHHIEVSWREINKYAECKLTADLAAINSDYKNDLTSNGTWAYPLRGLTHGTSAFEKSKVTHFESELLVLVKGERMLYGCSLTRWYIPLPRLSLGYIMFAYNPLAHCDIELPMLSDGNGMFHGSIMDKESTLSILNSIPAYTSGSHPLTIGIHVDHQSDDEVLEAIANAEAKGWTLTVQWNGTPTAQASVTYGLRKPPIYAKVSEHELPDGTVERYLDWGHYVTNPTGYEEFRSVEEAREYFGLPAEDEAITE